VQLKTELSLAATTYGEAKHAVGTIFD